MIDFMVLQMETLGMLGSRQLEIYKYKIVDHNLCILYLASSYQYSINIFL